MVGPPSILSSSATPTQKAHYNQLPLPPGAGVSRTSFERDGLQLPAHVNGTRNVPSPAMSFAPRGSSLVPSPAPGSFSSDLRSQLGPSRAASRLDISAMNLERLDEDDGHVAEQAETALREMLSREIKIKEGSENMLEALNTKKAKQTKDQRVRVEAELNSSNQRIKDLKSKLSNLQRPKPPTTPTKSRVGAVFQSSDVRSPASVPRSAEVTEDEEATESPTYVLAEILQALEIEGLAPDYYVNHANNLVDLFKRHPTLKYDLVWSVFGLRMQVLLLSESREVVAAGYRMIRHAISDLTSLQKIRSLNTDYLVILSLIKERKADVEREQALKFVRAFLEVKDGVHEVSRGVVQTIAAVAEHGEDRLKAISIETLAEILVRNPALLIASGAMRSLIDALGEGAYEASEGLTAAFLYILDTPQRRKYLRSGYELEILFTVFTDFSYTSERILKQSSKAIATALKSWSGLLTLSMYNFRALRSLISSLALPYTVTREVVIDLIFTLLRIKAPSWSSSFLAGRRLTTYGRVTNLKAPTVKATPTSNVDEDTAEQNLIDHYTALLLAMLIRADTLPALLQVTKDAENQSLKRKTVLLIGEILKLADKLLPTSWSYDLQLLPELFATAANFGEDERFQATSTVYQLDSVTKTLYKSSAADSPVESKKASENSSDGLNQFDEAPKSISNLTYDEATFRQMLVDSHVLASTNYLKWNWDVILRVIEGPLTHGKRLDEAVKASKFIKRIMSFYRPFKYKFAEVRMTRPSQKYIRVGCALMHTLLQTQEGVRFLSDNKLLRQIAECLAQIDPTSGLTAPSAMFSTVRIQETLCSGYFAMLGTLSRDIKGLRMLDRWRIFSMMYHIIDHKQRPDLIKLFLSNFDYSLHGHPRVILSKALTAACKDVRILATNVLRRAISRSSINSSNEAPGDFKWAIQLLVTQLYDPDVEVSAAAIRILEEACNRRQYLEYIVECRPALDHLGEIGAPLLLRFLSTSIGYHYLDGLDYISNEMDDWFLGRNDAYVGVIEAVLARAFSESNDESSRRTSFGEAQWEVDPVENDTHVPPHFYRELARTQEGCKLLHDKGHFDEFAATIREYGMQSDDPDVILKVKGCLWAVGNVGCMELGAPFLESTDVVEEIVKIAENHEVMSLRGTAFFVLGLISRSVHGLEMLLEHGWESNTTLMGESLGLCIPRKLETLFSLKPWQHEKAPDLTIDEKQRVALAASSKDEDPMNQRILALVSDLGNTVLTKRAISELGHIKQKKAPGFKQVTLFRKVITIIESHHFRLPVRRFVIDLFDKSVLRQIVLDEESSEEDFASDTGSDSATERQRSVSAPSAPPGI